MTDSPSHPGDELHLLLDGRLTSEQRAEVEAHLAQCGRCRKELELLRRVKTVVRSDLPDHPVPAEIAARVSATLAEEAAHGGKGAARVPRFRRRPVIIAVALAAAAALVVLLVRPGGRDLVSAAAQDFTRYRAATLPLDLTTTQPEVLEQYFIAANLPFSTRVFDFGMMGYRLAGGRVHRLAGRMSALFAYEGADGTQLVCEMFQGAVSELAPATEERENNGIRFRIYRTGGLTLVFWQEGSVVCVLVGAGDPEAVIQLAYAKAVRV